MRRSSLEYPRPEFLGPKASSPTSPEAFDFSLAEEGRVRGRSRGSVLSSDLKTGSSFDKRFSVFLSLGKLRCLDARFSERCTPPSQALSGPEGWNIPALGTLYKDAVKASALGDDARIVSDTNAMNTIANQAVMYLWTFYPLGGWDATADAVIAFTSNVAGFYWNPSTIVDGPYFASLAPSSMTTTTSSAEGAPATIMNTAAVAVVIAVVIVVAAMVLRSRRQED